MESKRFFFRGSAELVAYLTVLRVLCITDNFQPPGFWSMKKLVSMQWQIVYVDVVGTEIHS